MIPASTPYARGEGSKAPFNERAVVWLRWGAVLPAAIVATLVATGAINILVALLQTRNSDGNSTPWNLVSTHVLKQLAQAFFLPIAAIWAGTMAAPAYRNYVIVSLSTLWGVVLVFAYVIVGLASFQNQAPFTWWLMFVASIALNIAGVLCVLTEYRKVHMQSL